MSTRIACIPAFSQTHDRLPAAAEAALGSQGDASQMRSTPTLRGLNGQNENNGNNVLSAPGADAVMTQDLLLINPNKGSQPPQPLQSFVGRTLKINVQSKDINFRGLAGIMINVINDTNRPLVIDGDSAKALAGSQTYSSVSLKTLQTKVLPSKSVAAQTGRMIVQVAPAAATVGATPTIEDYVKMKKPIRKKYGSDQRRRLAELTRFGKRILWPHQETQGILYFEPGNDLKSAKVSIPVHTLFDTKDSATLQGS